NQDAPLSPAGTVQPVPTHAVPRRTIVMEPPHTARGSAPDHTPGPSTAAAPTSAEKIAIRDLRFYYKNFEALKGINLALYDKRVTAFIGPSGCGKSTLLRVLNRIYQLYPEQRATGEIIVDGRNILDPRIDLNLLRAKIGMVFQKPTPFPMSIHDNIAFGIK